MVDGQQSATRQLAIMLAVSTDLMVAKILTPNRDVGSVAPL
jgi:hypothetical protein